MYHVACKGRRSKAMRIKEVEDIVGITKKNIRFYEKEGLLSPGRESENGYRNYDEADVWRLKQIKLLRTLNMPISDIRLLFEGGLSLSEAARRHIDALDRQRRSIEKARVMCGILLEEQSDINSIDIDSYLSEIDRLEGEGVTFVDIRKNDVRKKYVESVAACVVVVAVVMLLLTGVLYTNKIYPTPKGIFLTTIAVLAIVAIGTVASLISRIREIKGGEENDLGKY
ncbi:MAG: MerR family transcriptional regulator [Butyricicoccus sp.]|nr:MerR family transcriptional regulator [Butyricicoccus sp.]